MQLDLPARWCVHNPKCYAFGSWVIREPQNDRDVIASTGYEEGTFMRIACGIKPV
jgi:hypothetical protein